MCCKKGFLGITPSRVVTFVRQLDDGSIFDKEIVPGSDNLEKKFWLPNGSVMAGLGHTTEDDLKLLKINLSILALLGSRSQPAKAEVKNHKQLHECESILNEP